MFELNYQTLEMLIQANFRDFGLIIVFFIQNQTTMDIFSIITTVVLLILLIWATNWFVNKKNRAKVTPSEDVRARTETPEPDEVDDPLNP